jgi:hypothetical protein
MKLQDIEKAAPPTSREDFTAGAKWLVKQLYIMPLDVAIDTICKLHSEIKQTE